VIGHASGINNRYLDRYPENGRRIWYLSLSVLVTIVLYYEYYVLGAVAPLIMKELQMSMTWLLTYG
jgi:hypothetical protein